VSVEFLTRGEEREGEDGARSRHAAESGRQQAIGILDFRHTGLPGAMEGGRRDDQDGGIDDKANDRATVESMNAYLKACALPAGVSG